jgi:hypothetical protein
LVENGLAAVALVVGPAWSDDGAADDWLAEASIALISMQSQGKKPVRVF